MSSTLSAPVEVPPGFWVREAGHAPFPSTPLTRPFWEQRAIFREVCAEMGFLIEGLDSREINGWMYLSVIPLVDKAGPHPPASIAADLFETVPALRGRIRCAVAAVREDRATQLAQRWYQEWRGELAARIAGLREVDLNALTDDELGRHYESALELGEDGKRIHFRLWGAMVVALGQFDQTCREMLGWADAAGVELLTGTSVSSTEPTRALAPLLAAANRSSELRSLLQSGAPIDDVLAVDAEFAARFAAYQRDYGCRALRYDLGEATLAERPDVVLDLLREQLERSGDHVKSAPSGELAVAAARRSLADREPEEIERFERDLARARVVYPAREDNEFFTISSPLAVLRGTALHIGERLARRGLLDAAGDVFFLEVTEMLTALNAGNDRRSDAARRRAARAAALIQPGPPAYGTPPGPPPPMDSLPAEARQVDAALWWAIEHIAAPAGAPRKPTADRTVVTGIGAGAGTYRGPVRVIRDERDFHKLRAGDVLVCPITSPVWSVLFTNIGALVTDIGGMLSHSAIIAREFGIPAVVATGDGTTRLRDGHIVTVDGSSGTVLVGP